MVACFAVSERWHWTRFTTSGLASEVYFSIGRVFQQYLKGKESLHSMCKANTRPWYNHSLVLRNNSCRRNQYSSKYLQGPRSARLHRQSISFKGIYLTIGLHEPVVARLLSR